MSAEQKLHELTLDWFKKYVSEATAQIMVMPIEAHRELLEIVRKMKSIYEGN